MSTSVAPRPAAGVDQLIEFLGLTDFVDHTAERPSFPLGVLYPYTADLRRVCDRYTEVAEAFPAIVPLLLGASSHAALVEEAAVEGVSRYLSSIKVLKGRIDFAPGGVGLAVGEAYRLATLAVRGARAV
jgi:hypothetical protein